MALLLIFPDDTDSALFTFRRKITGQTENDGTNDVQIMVPLKYLSNFWRTLKMPLTNYESFSNFV